MRLYYYLLISACLTAFHSAKAQKQFIKYHFNNQQYDTLPAVQYNKNITAETTSLYLGKDSNIATLPNSLPAQNTYPQSQYTYKEKAAVNYNLTDFPLRAVIKTFSVEDDSLIDNCSGIMISKNHMLTAAHCLVSLITDSVFVDSLKVCPAFNNGITNGGLNCTYAKQFYYPESFSFTEDLTVVELKDSIGKETGWLGVGFNQNNSFLANGKFFKLSYPSATIPSLDPRIYNGDTLFFSYGAINLIDSSYLGVNSASGVPGESGSSLIRYNNNSEYTSYGTFSLSSNLRHSRINAWEYYAIKSFITPSLINSTTESIVRKEDLVIYPNPSKDLLFIKLSNLDNLPFSINVMDIRGKVILNSLSLRSKVSSIDVRNLKPGLYFIEVENSNNKKRVKFIKR